MLSSQEHGQPRAIKGCPEYWSESTQSRQSQHEILWIPSAPLYNKRRIQWENVVLEASYHIAKTAELQVFNQVRTTSGMMLYISWDRPCVLLSVDKNNSTMFSQVFERILVLGDMDGTQCVRQKIYHRHFLLVWILRESSKDMSSINCPVYLHKVFIIWLPYFGGAWWSKPDFVCQSWGTWKIASPLTYAVHPNHVLPADVCVSAGCATCILYVLVSCGGELCCVDGQRAVMQISPHQDTQRSQTVTVLPS